MQWLIGNGFEVIFWTFNWYFPFPLYNLVLDLLKPLLNLSLTVDNIVVDNHAWNLTSVNQFLLAEVISHITSMPLPMNYRLDEFIWGRKSTIKSASELQNAHVATHTHAKLLDIMWKLQLPSKVKIFRWLLICQRFKPHMSSHNLFSHTIIGLV